MNAKLNDKPWYKNWWGIILAILFLPFFALWYLWSKTKLNNVVKVILTMLILIITAVAAAGSSPPKNTAQNTSNSTQSKSTTTKSTPAIKSQPKSSSPAAPAESQAQKMADYKNSATSATVSQIANDPSNYDGSVVTFTAVIANFVQDSSGSTTAMNVTDPNDLSSIIYVQLSSFADVTQMNKGDTITVWGDGQGDIQGKNSFGAKINEAGVNEVYLTDTTTGYQDNSDTNPM